MRERDLPFLSKDTEIGLQLREAVIDAEMDDDCQTDDELAEKAKQMLSNNLSDAIETFARHRPYSDEYIANLNDF